jgi:hypothetical protein
VYFEYQSAFFLNFHSSSYVSGGSELQTKRMASVEQFLVEVMLFAVALLGSGWGGDVVT